MMTEWTKCSFDDLSRQAPTSKGFSPSFILPSLFLSGASVQPSTLVKLGVRLIVDARLESSLRKDATTVDSSTSTGPRHALVLDVEYRQDMLLPKKPPTVLGDEGGSAADLLRVLASEGGSAAPTARFVVLSIPALDREDFPIDHFFDITCRHIGMAMDMQVGVLVHCAAGVSRSVTLMAAFLCKRFRLDCASAVRFLRQRRPMASPNDGFYDQLVSWNLKNRSTPNNAMDDAQAPRNSADLAESGCALSTE
jgi:hypothetical protein